MKLFTFLMFLCLNAFAGANFREAAPRVSPQNVILYVPWEMPTTECQNVEPWKTPNPRNFYLVHRTFQNEFDAMPALANGDGAARRWAPHFDGGFNAPYHQGYAWEAKRTQQGSHEQQLYVDPAFTGSGKLPLGLNPFSVYRGVLSITASRTPENAYASLWAHDFISGVLSSHEMYAQQYGYFEMSARLPGGSNLLPAFWLLPYRPAPAPRTSLPEIDIMEAPGNQAYAGKLSLASHWLKNEKRVSSGCTTPAVNDGNFHLYSALLLPDRVVYYVDRLAVAQIAAVPGMDADFYVMANLAVGGDWVGFVTPGNNQFPQTMEIDYISGYTATGIAGCRVDGQGVKVCR